MDGPTRILFLDCDGVINTQAYTAQAMRECAVYIKHTPDADDATMARFVYAADPVRVASVIALCDRTGARIVVSSVWRADMARIRELFDTVLHPTDPATTRDYPVPGDHRRGTQIAEWLSRHPEVDTYAIVDDDSDMLDEQQSRFVQTTYIDGLTPATLDQLHAILEADQWT